MTNKPLPPAVRDPRDPLFLTLATLDHVPRELHEQYARQMDGTFRLMWINQGDTASYNAHMALIGSRLDLVPDGETLTTMEAKAALRDIDIRLAISDAEIAHAEKAQVQAQTQRADRARYEAGQAERRRRGLLTDADFRALRASATPPSDESTSDDEAAA